MSPSKSPSTATKRANVPKSASAIPRRVKQSTTESGLMFAGESVNISPPKPVSYQDVAGANKENLPATVSGGRVVYAVSPTRQPTGVSKPSKLIFKRKVSSRVPLRELNEQEVYERDEAILGDLRRRRSGERGAFEVDSVLVGPSPLVHQAGRSSSTWFSSTNLTNASRSTVATEANDEENLSRFRVLKRTDSEERLRAKINVILENAAVSKSPSNKAIRRKLPQTKPSRFSPVKLHPAIRQSSPPRSSHHSESLSSPEDVSTGSPASSPLRIRDLPASPLRILRSPSPISRIAPPQAARVGLGTKSINTIPTGKKSTTGGKPKKVIVATSSTLPKKTVAKKPGVSMLRRAAGPMISAAATSRLDEMRKMR